MPASRVAMIREEAMSRYSRSPRDRIEYLRTSSTEDWSKMLRKMDRKSVRV